MRFLKIHLRYIHFWVYSALREIERKRKDAKRQIKWTVLNGFPFPSIRPASELYASVEISKAVDLFKRQPDTGACPLSVDPSSLLAGWDGWDYLHSLVVGVDSAHDGAVQRCWFEAMPIHQLFSRNGFIYQGGYKWQKVWAGVDLPYALPSGAFFHDHKARKHSLHLTFIRQTILTLSCNLC